MHTLKKLWRNDYFQTIITIAIIVLIVFGFWNALQFTSGTKYPIVAVSGASMCTLPGSHCDGWTHPFERTLHDGDLVFLQGVNPEDIKVGDIIVYSKSDGDLIIHRVITIIPSDTDGKIYFETQGDGNNGPDRPLVSQDDVVGRVVFRIPWLGHIMLLMRSSFAAFIIVAIILLLIFELVFSVFVGKEEGKSQKRQDKGSGRTSET